MNKNNKENNKSKMESEPILIENKKRYVIFPIIHQIAWKFYKDHQAAHWFPEEIMREMPIDKQQWGTLLNANERKYLSWIFGFFAASDGIVNENLAQNFYNEVQIPELRAFYSEQIAMETIHSEVYSRFINELIVDKDEQTMLFNAIETIDTIRQKAEWAFKWMDKEKNSFAERVIAFAAVEGIFFSSSFAAIFWLRKRTDKSGVVLLPAIIKANQWISRDEGMHRDFACYIYRDLIQNKLSRESVCNIINEAVDIEMKFCRDSLPVSLLGMNSNLMCQYIQYVADHLLEELGLPSYYNVENPFSWMESISLPTEEKFFERITSVYTHPALSGTSENNHGDKHEIIDDI